jgi:glycosyltransferase involved in cell wall biosynthesis
MSTGRDRHAEQRREPASPAPRSAVERPAAADPSDQVLVAALARILDGLDSQGRVLLDLERRLKHFEDRVEADLRPGRGIRSIARVLLDPRLTRYRHYPPRPLRVPERYRRPAPSPSAPRLTIVTPCRNAARYLEGTLRSVLAQDYEALEYIVQDGASTDGTAAILERYRPRLASVESARDAGQADALNRGFSRATGEILGYLNADDLLLPGALHYVARFFVDHPEVDAVYGHRVIIDDRDREVGRWVLPPHDGRVLCWADWIPQETLFWRREIWRKAGGLVDPSFRFALDWDLILRLRDAGARFVRLPRFLGAFRVHEAQKSARELETIGYEEMQRIREREHGAPTSMADVSRGVRAYLLRHVLYDRLYRLRVLRY